MALTLCISQFGHTMTLEKPSKVDDRGLVGDSVLADFESAKAARGLDVVERVLGRGVGEIESPLQAIDPEYRLERRGQAPLTHLRIVRRDALAQPLPIDDPAQPLQEMLAVDGLLRASEGERRGDRLFHCVARRRTRFHDVSALDARTCSIEFPYR